jgi:DNA-binding NarL/FixJ family response regulator
MTTRPPSSSHAGASPGVIRLLLVDDHPLVRAAIANLLSFEQEFEVVGQVNDGESAIETWRRLRPDVCLLDITLEGIDGFETLTRLHMIDSGARVVMLTSSDSHEDMQHALEAGAHGFVTKAVDYADLVTAIRTVHAGGTFVSQHLKKAPTAGIASQSFKPLTAREREVLGLLRQGFTNADIGRLLGASERTARAHVESIKDKLQCNHRAEAVARGFELGILKVQPPR